MFQLEGIKMPAGGFKNKRGSVTIWVVFLIILIGLPMMQLVVGLSLLVYDRHQVNNSLEAAVTAMASNTEEVFTDNLDDSVVVEQYDQAEASRQAYDIFTNNLEINGLKNIITPEKDSFKSEYVYDSNGNKKCKGTITVSIKLFRIFSALPETVKYQSTVTVKTR